MATWSGKIRIVTQRRSYLLAMNDVVDVRIDESTWMSGTDARRQEWSAAARSLGHADDMRFASGIVLVRVELTQQAFELGAWDANDIEVAHHTLPHDGLRDFVTEYIDIVRQLARTDGLARLEALDMAKKVVHDKAGRWLRKYCDGFNLNLPSARRLFTLLLTLKVDTTRIIGVHGHRRIRG